MILGELSNFYIPVSSTGNADDISFNTYQLGVFVVVQSLSQPGINGSSDRESLLRQEYSDSFFGNYKLGGILYFVSLELLSKFK